MGPEAATSRPPVSCFMAYTLARGMIRATAGHSHSPPSSLCAHDQTREPCGLLEADRRSWLPGRIREIFGGSRAMGHQRHMRLSFTHASNDLITLSLLRRQNERLLLPYRRQRKSLL